MRTVNVAKMLTITFGYDDEHIPRKNTPINGAVIIYDTNAEEATCSVIDSLIEQMADAYGALPYRQQLRTNAFTDTLSTSLDNTDFLLQMVPAKNHIAFEQASKIAVEAQMCCLTLFLADDDLADACRWHFPAPHLWATYDSFQDVLLDWVEVVHLPSHHIGLDFGDISLLFKNVTKGLLYRIKPG